jgi:transcriptional regulator with XRE-family HTH domain
VTKPIRLACRTDVIEVPLDQILPTRRLNDAARRTVKYRCIKASVHELGLIEPLVVFPDSKVLGKFILLDGHVRYTILKDRGVASAKCLVAADDEGLTYNHKVNRLSAIQEHFMILRAVKSGVSEERIARSLNVDVASIRQKRDLLDGICPEAVQLIRDRKVTATAIRELRKVKPLRQIEIAELMCTADNYSVGYVKCLVATTAADHLVDPDRGKDVRDVSPEELSRIEHEMASQARELRFITESHGRNTLHLVVAVSYLKRLLDNSRVSRYLTQRYPEIQAELKKLVEEKQLMEETP